MGEKKLCDNSISEPKTLGTLFAIYVAENTFCQAVLIQLQSAAAIRAPKKFRLEKNLPRVKLYQVEKKINRFWNLK